MAKFTLTYPASLTPEHQTGIGQAWLAGGYDMAPLAGDYRVGDNQLEIQRATNESGSLCVPWKIGNSQRVVSTSTLRNRPDPYRLPIEMLRGSINRIRNLVAALDSAFVPIPTELQTELSEITRRFGRVLIDDSPTHDASVEDLIAATALLSDKYSLLTSEYKLDSRKEANGGPLNMKLGCRLRAPLTPDEATVYASTFNAVRIVPVWKQVEAVESSYQWSQLDPLLMWATDAGLDVTVGPLIDLSSACLPDWVHTWENDLPSLTAFMSDFIGTIVGKYRSKVRSWQLFGGINNKPSLGLSEDDRLRLAGRLMQSAKDIDSSVRWTFGISQPHGDYLRVGHSRYAPLMFADTLLRSGFQVAGIDLDLTESDSLGSNIPRDALDLMHAMDMFESLGVPLTATLGGCDANAVHVEGRVQAAGSAFALTALYWDGWTAGQGIALKDNQLVYNGQPDSPALREFRRFRTHWLK